jgi:hypothetical protein
MRTAPMLVSPKQLEVVGKLPMVLDREKHDLVATDEIKDEVGVHDELSDIVPFIT